MRVSRGFRLGGDDEFYHFPTQHIRIYWTTRNLSLLPGSLRDSLAVSRINLAPRKLLRRRCPAMW